MEPVLTVRRSTGSSNVTLTFAASFTAVAAAAGLSVMIRGARTSGGFARSNVASTQ